MNCLTKGRCILLSPTVNLTPIAHCLQRSFCCTTMASTHTIHDAASKGFFDAQKYDAHRPSYPPAALTSLLRYIGLENKPKSRIIDLAAGTGKFTELLAVRPEEYEIIAVEPLDSMRDTLAAKKLKGVDVRAGTAANIESVEDGWADGVIVAQVRGCDGLQDALS